MLVILNVRVCVLGLHFLGFKYVDCNSCYLFVQCCKRLHLQGEGKASGHRAGSVDGVCFDPRHS